MSRVLGGVVSFSSHFTVKICFFQLMKVKLQPPSAIELPPYNPILPPSAITQVMILANPQKVG
jgi:ADP-ribosylation factor-binding protein GGA